jgi:hypothetical protein
MPIIPILFKSKLVQFVKAVSSDFGLRTACCCAQCTVLQYICNKKNKQHLNSEWSCHSKPFAINVERRIRRRCMPSFQLLFLAASALWRFYDAKQHQALISRERVDGTFDWLLANPIRTTIRICLWLKTWSDPYMRHLRVVRDIALNPREICSGMFSCRNGL